MLFIKDCYNTMITQRHSMTTLPSSPISFQNRAWYNLAEFSAGWENILFCFWLILWLKGGRNLLTGDNPGGNPFWTKSETPVACSAGWWGSAVWLAGDQTAAGRCTQFASWAQQKQIWGLCLYVSQKCAKPTFCVCILLYLFIIIANVYFNVQISAKYTTHNSTILNFGIILKR